MALFKPTITAYSPVRLLGLLCVVMATLLLVHLLWSPRSSAVSRRQAAFANPPLSHLPMLQEVPSRQESVAPNTDHMQTQFQRLVHLDLKGAPLSLPYMRKTFPLMKELGVTGLLVEYEDMFPYWGALSTLAHPACYNRSDIAELQELALTHNFTLIPLVQSFGHLEFVLKHDKWKHLRANAISQKGINPSLNESLRLLMSMFDQMLELHPNAAYIHIGGDEVYTLGQSKETKARMRDNGLSRDEIYLIHLTYLAQYIKNKRPSVISIFWDDMIRHINLDLLKLYNLERILQPMLWGYTTTLKKHFPDTLWKKYAEIFPHIWLASSFKGATGQAQYIVDIEHHLANHKAWIQLMKKYSGLFKSINGITLTGWQRYDHNLPLCELFPVGIPSLAVNVKTLAAGRWDEQLWLQTTKALKCEGLLEIKTTPMNEGYHACTFPGSTVYDAVHEIHKCITKLNQLQKDSDLYFLKGKVSKALLSKDSIDTIIRELHAVQKTLEVLHNALPAVLSEILLHDIEEWMKINVYAHETTARDMMKKAEAARMQLG